MAGWTVRLHTGGRGPTVLAVTSSTAVVGVALVRDGSLLAHSHVTTDRRHAEELTPMVQKVVTGAEVELEDVDFFAVDVGPGRFTGLRVGLATVRALAMALDRPVVGMTSLELLALDRGGPVCAVIDARRNEVFQQRFVDGTAVDGPVVGDPAALARLVQPDDVVVGDGADRYEELYSVGELLNGCAPSAITLARASAGRPPLPGREIDPLYLRDADVKINIKTRHSLVERPPKSGRNA